MLFDADVAARFVPRRGRLLGFGAPFRFLKKLLRAVRDFVRRCPRVALRRKRSCQHGDRGSQWPRRPQLFIPRDGEGSNIFSMPGCCRIFRRRGGGRLISLF